MTQPDTGDLLAGSVATGAGRGVRMPCGGLHWSWASVRPWVIKRNYETDKVDCLSFITTSVMSLRCHRLAIKTSRSL